MIKKLNKESGENVVSTIGKMNKKKINKTKD